MIVVGVVGVTNTFFSLGVIASVMVLVIGRGVRYGCVGNRVGEGGFDV